MFCVEAKFNEQRKIVMKNDTDVSASYWRETFLQQNLILESSVYNEKTKSFIFGWETI